MSICDCVFVYIDNKENCGKWLSTKLLCYNPLYSIKFLKACLKQRSFPSIFPYKVRMENEGKVGSMGRRWGILHQVTCFFIFQIASWKM